MAVVEDDSSSNPSSQLRKAKTELQDGFQLSYQPAALNQLQDGGDNLSILIPFLLLSSRQSVLIHTSFIFCPTRSLLQHMPTARGDAKNIFLSCVIYFAGSLFQHVSTAGGDAENNAENQGKLTTMWNMA